MKGHLTRFREQTPGGPVLVEWYDPTTLRMSASEGYFASRKAAEAAVGPETPARAFCVAQEVIDEKAALPLLR